MEGNNKDTGKEKETAVKKKKKNFFKSNFIVILLILLSGGAIAVNEYDKKNNETIYRPMYSKFEKFSPVVIFWEMWWKIINKAKSPFSDLVDLLLK